MTNEEKQILVESDLQLLNQLKEYLDGIENILNGLHLVEWSEFNYHKYEMSYELLDKAEALEIVIKNLKDEQSRENIN